MKTVFLLAVICVWAITSCEGGRWNWWSWRRRTVTYTIRNVLQEPMFEMTQTLRLYRREPFLAVMERAATANSSFRFSADYFNHNLGYFITTINKLSANFEEDKTFWEFLSAPDIFLQKGVSNYFPRSGEHIIFNFTMGGHS
ncbi:uncharacterized protein LOC135470037 [Liolophura sinensis]|uniref:uncharacterized protein LOC135470037 n=1 Tax=Liolophura sinensis TaxID=3198878 RepID=UPI003158FDA7